jgi:hypothetical protein
LSGCQSDLPSGVGCKNSDSGPTGRFEARLDGRASKSHLCHSPRQCSRNRCLAWWTVWIPYHGRGGAARRANSKKDLLTGLIRVSVAFSVLGRRAPTRGRS